jgi:superfamily II DNA/RNA helicase
LLGFAEPAIGTVTALLRWCVLQVVRELSRDSSLRTAVLVGGDAMEAQFAELAHNPDIIVATPGKPAS